LSHLLLPTTWNLLYQADWLTDLHLVIYCTGWAWVGTWNLYYLAFIDLLDKFQFSKWVAQVPVAVGSSERNTFLYFETTSHTPEIGWEGHMQVSRIDASLTS